MLRILQVMLTCNAYSLFWDLRSPSYVHMISCKVKDKILSWKLHGHSACKFRSPLSAPLHNYIQIAIFPNIVVILRPKKKTIKKNINMYISYMICKSSIKQDKFNIKKQPTICRICILQVTSHQSRMHQNIYVSMFPQWVIFVVSTTNKHIVQIKIWGNKRLLLWYISPHAWLTCIHPSATFIFHFCFIFLLDFTLLSN